MAGVIEGLKNLYERWVSGRRKGLVLTLIAVESLRRRGEKATVDAVRREGLRLIRETRDTIDWGITEEKYSQQSVVTGLLRELVEMGVLEEVNGVYRLKTDGEPEKVEEEIMSRFGSLIILARKPA